MPAFLRKARVRQIRFCSRVFKRLGRRARRIPGFSVLAGYQHPFATLRDAEEAIARYTLENHSSLQNVEFHLAQAAKPRPSDYAALFHLRQIMPDIRRVFDLGGNVGNLFYCYAKVLDFRPDLVWTVLDLPKTRAIGERIARQWGEPRLRFTNDLEDADGADLFIASGSLHYFEQPLFERIAALEHRPRYILINRTPLTDTTPVAAIQDAGSFLVACKLFNKRDLLHGFEAQGYEAVDDWAAEELSLVIPGYPEFSVPRYSGIFLQLRHPAVCDAGVLTETLTTSSV